MVGGDEDEGNGRRNGSAETLLTCPDQNDEDAHWLAVATVNGAAIVIRCPSLTDGRRRS